MALPKKTYIQNCTGSHLGVRKNKDINEIVSKVIFYVLLVAFFGVTGYVLFFSSYLRVSNIVITGNTELGSEDLKNIIEKKQQGKFFKIIPRDNFLLVSDSDLEKSLSSEFRKIKNVSVLKKFPDTLEVDLSERKALLLLCGGEKCFLIDENGTAYSDVDFNSPEIIQNHLIKISDKGARDIKIGDAVMDQSYVKYVSSLGELLLGIGIEIEDELWTPSLMAEEVNVKVKQGGEIYFSTQLPLENSIKTLDVALGREPLKSQRSNISYVDLRTENKIFYKLNNSESSSNENNDNKGGDSKK